MLMRSIRKHKPSEKAKCLKFEFPKINLPSNIFKTLKNCCKSEYIGNKTNVNNVNQSLNSLACTKNMKCKHHKI